MVGRDFPYKCSIGDVKEAKTSPGKDKNLSQIIDIGKYMVYSVCTEGSKG